MLESVCYAFIYLFEVLAYLIFFENYYHRKNSKLLCFSVYCLAFVIEFGIHFISIPLLNLVTFFLCCFFIPFICYNAKIKSCFFTALMLTIFMFVTEMFVAYSSSLIFKIDLDAYENNILLLIIQPSLSKLLFFVVIFFTSKILNNKAENSSSNKFTIMLSVLPIISIIILHFLSYWSLNALDSSRFFAALALCAILLLFANLFVFYIYEMVQKTNFEITQLQLEKQRGEISAEYYRLLSKEYENSRVLIHDIKNHLHYIESKTADGESKEVLNYIDSIREDFGLNERIRYSGNGLIDVIINRHANFCKANGVNFEVEACCSKLDFMNESDITSLLDNLLDNAVESAVQSEEKKIVFSIYIRSDSFVVVSVINSCDSAPVINNGRLISSKRNPKAHGYGTKSIKRVVNKYNCDFKWAYNELDREFEASVILQTE